MTAKDLLKILDTHKNIIDGGTEILITSVPHPKKNGTGIYFTEDAIFNSTQNILTIFVDKELSLKELGHYSDE